MKFKKITFSDLGFYKPRESLFKMFFFSLIWASLIALTIQLVEVYAENLLNYFNFFSVKKDEINFKPNLSNWNTLLYNLVYTCTYVCFVEELMFRGILQKYILNDFIFKNKYTWLSISISSLAFAFAHSYYGGIGVFLVFLISIWFGIIFYKKQYNIWYLIIIHALYDNLLHFQNFFGLSTIDIINFIESAFI